MVVFTVASDDKIDSDEISGLTVRSSPMESVMATSMGAVLLAPTYPAKQVFSSSPA